ncbi:uncharacterized protein [Macrobrachium rosenbergii]|uniref:uncharacterized protein n=1 Tax=Macrobrachium rosenbergii TaxID=79674 RepID=UPI0034D5EDC5
MPHQPPAASTSFMPHQPPVASTSFVSYQPPVISTSFVPYQPPVASTSVAPHQPPVASTSFVPHQPPVASKSFAPHQPPVASTSFAPHQPPVASTSFAPQLSVQPKKLYCLTPQQAAQLQRLYSWPDSIPGGGLSSPLVMTLPSPPTLSNISQDPSDSFMENIFPSSGSPEKSIPLMPANSSTR